MALRTGTTKIWVKSHVRKGLRCDKLVGNEVSGGNAKPAAEGGWFGHTRPRAKPEEGHAEPAAKGGWFGNLWEPRRDQFFRQWTTNS
jgi:hypothetical protein